MGFPSTTFSGHQALAIFLDISGLAVVDEYRRVRLGLAHLARDDPVHLRVLVDAARLRLLQPGEDVVMDGDGLLPAERREDLPRQHVHLPLVHPRVDDVQVHGVHVRRLHRRVEVLCDVELLLDAPPHYRQAPDVPLEADLLGEPHHVRPVLLVLLVELAPVPYLDAGAEETERVGVVLVPTFLIFSQSPPHLLLM